MAFSRSILRSTPPVVMKRVLSLFLIAVSLFAQPVRGGSRTGARGVIPVSPSSDTLRIMPLGDSITELDWEGGYRSYLYKMLTDSGFVFDFVGTKTTNHDDANLGFTFPQKYWDHEGYNSATITGQSGSAWVWNQNIAGKLAANPPDVVLVLLGTNDLNNGCCSGLDVKNQMSAFLDQIWSFDPNITVVLGSPPSVDSARYPTLNGRITDYDSYLPSLVIEKVTLGRRVSLADHHAVMNSGTDLVGDGIHPSPQGYRKMARVWYDALTTAEVPPTGPSLLSPADGDTIPRALLGSVVFLWNASLHADTGTALTYTLNIFGPGTDYSSNPLTDTTVDLDLSSLAAAGGSYRWTVDVSDGLVSVASGDTFHFLVNPATGVDEEPGGMPSAYSLGQNYPNPFNPSTSIHYAMPERAYVRLQVFDVLGRVVATLVEDWEEPGYRSAVWDASSLPGGVYFCRLTAGTFTETRKMLLMR
jgi:lysophospholipase L1-like esterase